jgi:hypothetical protein
MRTPFGPLALLSTGKVLLAGTNSMLYDPSTNDWTMTGSMNQVRADHTLTLLLNGQALGAGWYIVTPDFETVQTAELYTP